MATPRCSCEPFPLVSKIPRMGLHMPDCPAFCDCPDRGRRGTIVHREDCGWYKPDPTLPEGPIRGMRPLLVVLDEMSD